jgi:hypothetical protein
VSTSRSPVADRVQLKPPITRRTIALPNLL